MALWLHKLHQLQQMTSLHSNYTASTSIDLNSATVKAPVFLGGSKFYSTRILDEIRQRYMWADISNITYDILMQRYRNHNAVMQYMQTNRSDKRIYALSDKDLTIRYAVKEYINCHGIDCANADTLNEMFAISCKSLLEPSTSKIIIILDCRLCYFVQNCKNDDTLLLEMIFITCGLLALFSLRHMHPFIEFIILCDEYKHDVDFKESCISPSFVQCIVHLQGILKNNLMDRDHVSHNFDMDYVVETTMKAHKSTNVIDYELG